MVSAAHINWHEANQQYLTAALGRVRQALERHAAGAAPEPRPQAAEPGGELPVMPAPPALDTLGTLFDLSPFERDVLLLCAGMELDAAFAALCAAAQGDPQRSYPTFSLALAALPGGHWSALTPMAPLRRWRLLEVGSGGALVSSPLRIDERVLHYVTGVQHLDGHLLGFLEPVALRVPDDLLPSHQEAARRIAATFEQASGQGLLPAIQLWGNEPAGKRDVAAGACHLLGLNLYRMPAHVVPVAPQELDSLMRLWEREAALSNSALLLDCDDMEQPDPGREFALRHLIESTGGVLLVATRTRRPTRHRSLLTFDVGKPQAREQRAMWDMLLAPVASGLNGHLDQIVAQFDLSAPAINAACVQAWSGWQEDQGEQLEQLGTRLWQACRMQARPQLDDLAQRIEPVAGWDDLVLPERQKQTLREIAAHVRQRSQVYESWGFAARSSRGLGISALFAGASGTGKTMAAEVLANALQLDLYVIDLSQVVSKYIGETEKNLRQVFDAAESGGAILLFDEADALFGKRSEVKDSHDRYANIEVSYLLQRMESYRGLAILTTNMRDALDTAFLRRIRFIVQFPFPDAGQRAEIWRGIFPTETPTEGLDVLKLAQLNVAGGNIRNIAMNAAFLAADEGEPVRMAHVLSAARSEYSKLEKPLTGMEVRGWELAGNARETSS